jgi:16S rRNA (adenine1518-N6/adenine1519-N6)-dimethyltransferase
MSNAPPAGATQRMRQRLGQHFLTDRTVSLTAVDALALSANDTVIEVGPGRGALTLRIAERLATLPGTALIAIERDPVLAEEVRTALRNCGTHTEVVEGDVRSVLREVTERVGPYKLTGNLPYYLTGFFFRLVGELSQKPERAVFMVQREVAERMVAQPPSMNLLAAAIQHWTSVSLIATVPVSAFSPRPHVEGALILLTPHRSQGNSAAYYRLVRALFKQPRKTIRNNVVAAAPNLGIPVHAVEGLLERSGIDPGERPQTVSVAAIERLAGSFETTA